MNKLNIDLNNIPQTFGVYFWKNNEDEIIYIGKAKNIKKRIMQYINGSLNSYKTKHMLENANKLDFIVCSNEKETLLLEQEMIKKHRPSYNILLLDDKKYPFIRVTLTKNKLDIQTKFSFKENKNTFSYGPLPIGFGSKIIKNFLIRECLFEKGLPIKNNDHFFWKEKFDYAKKILFSDQKEIMQKLEQQMFNASKNEQFEIATEIRDTLNYLNKSNETKQAINFKSNENIDILDFFIKDNFLLLTVHHFLNGIFNLQEEFIFEIKIDEDETIEGIINQLYEIRNVPSIVITNRKIDVNNINIKTNFIIPKRGIYLQALNNAHKNNLLNIENKIMKFIKKNDDIDLVKKYLFKITKKEVNDLIMIDNSNFHNENITSVIIYYKKYRPYFKNYRKFTLNKNNLQRLSDVEYLKNGINLYFNHSNEKPDLIIVDGGKQQINESKKTLNILGINIPIIGLVKNHKHKTSYLIDENNIKHNFDNQQILNFFAAIQIEVDRFAKNYHRKKSIQNSIEGFLSSIKGIGEATETKLLNFFKTYANIYNASEEELSKVVSPNLAKKIIEEIKKIE